MTNHMTMGLWTTLLVTAAAGVGGTGLGGLLATLFRRDSGREASLLLSFAAGVMVSVSWGSSWAAASRRGSTACWTGDGPPAAWCWRAW